MTYHFRNWCTSTLSNYAEHELTVEIISLFKVTFLTAKICSKNVEKWHIFLAALLSQASQSTTAPIQHKRSFTELLLHASFPSRFQHTQGRCYTSRSIKSFSNTCRSYSYNWFKLVERKISSIQTAYDRHVLERPDGKKRLGQVPRGIACCWIELHQKEGLLFFLKHVEKTKISNSRLTLSSCS